MKKYIKNIEASYGNNTLISLEHYFMKSKWTQIVERKICVKYFEGNSIIPIGNLMHFCCSLVFLAAFMQT